MSWQNEWKVKGAYPTKRMRDSDYKKLLKKYGSKKVRKVDRKTYIVFGKNLPYLIRMRRGAEFGM